MRLPFRRATGLNALWNFCFALLVLTYSSVQAQDTDPYLFILGVVQDAGYPQAGCYAPHCLPGWENPALKRGATSVALVDTATQRNYLFEATPDLPQQLFDLREQADYPLAGVFLTHAHIGHYAGLMYFGREAMGASGIPV
jgi:pyrroloquinoline quinone biosynthesis protein B